MKNAIQSMKIFFIHFLLIAFCNNFYNTANAQSLDSKGTDFWLTFTRNYDNNAVATLFITGESNTTGVVSIPGLSYSTTFSVTAGAITSVVLPSTVLLTSEDVIMNNGIHVTAKKEITVYGLNREQYTTDAFLGLPTDILGTDYINLGYIPNGYSSEFGIVATQNSTTITITPTAAASIHAINVPYNIVLNQGQTYMLGSTSGDLSGSIITSNKPIAVFGGHQCANIPLGYYACDYVVEELPPTSEWGKNFVTVPLKTRLRGDTYRFLASNNGTSVKVNGSVVATLNRGQFFETILTDASQITSTKPILVAQYSNGSQFDGVTSDPFMMLVPPYEQFLGSYTITTPATGFSANFVNIAAPKAAVGSITLDGIIIPASSFSPIGTSGFSKAQVDIDLGAHTLKSRNLPFGVFVYGYADYDSYGYPGGESLSPIAHVNSVSLSPKNGTAVIGTEQCFDALVEDQFNHPVPSIRVDFTITGPNAASTGFVFTDNNGVAHFCYTGNKTGTDKIVASVGTIKDEGSFIWTSVLNVYYSKPTGDLHNLLTWGINHDGSGANPPNFGAGKTFVLANRTINYNMTTDWTVDGLIVDSINNQLHINGFTLSEAGIIGGGKLAGSVTSNLIVTGTSGGDAGNLIFTSSGSSLNNLTLNRTGTSASATVGTSLNIYGVLTITHGTLNTGNKITLKSTASNTARVAPVTGTISGNVTVERYIPARRAWRIMSAPVGGFQSINAAWQEGATTASANPNPHPGYGTHITEGTTNGFDHNPLIAMASIKKYISSSDSWVPLANTNVTSVNSDAYLLFVRGDRGLSLGYNTVPPTITTLRATGPLKTGDQTFAVSATGFTAIPNPFASPINFATTTRNNVPNNFYLYDPKLGGPTGIGGYVLLSFNGSTYDVTPASVSPESQYIQSGQGFLVHSTGTAGSIVIKESDKSATAATNAFRSANTTQGLRINLQSVNADNATAILDEIFSSYNSRYSNKIDDMDALKMPNIEENLSIVSMGQNLMLERKGLINTSDTIHLNLWNTTQKNYLLEFNPIGFNSAELYAELTDNYLHTVTPISLDNISHFTIKDAAVTATGSNRFMVVIARKGLPIALTGEAAGINCYPNPLSGKLINVKLTNQPEGMYNIELINGTGQVVYKSQLKHAGGTSIEAVHLANKPVSGIYQVRVTNGTLKNVIPIIIK